MKRALRRGGFTLVFVIVVTAIMAVLFATAASTFNSVKLANDVQTTWGILAAIDSGICGEATSGGGACVASSFYLNAWSGMAMNPTFTNPGLVSELSSVIVASSLNYQNSCWAGAADEFNNTNVNNWNTNGAFLRYYVNPRTSNAIYTPLGYINDTLFATAANNTAGLIKIAIAGVDSQQVLMLDQFVDGGDGNASGHIQWTNTWTNRTTTVYYYAHTELTC